MLDSFLRECHFARISGPRTSNPSSYALLKVRLFPGLQVKLTGTSQYSDVA